MFSESGLRLPGECRLIPFILGEIDGGESEVRQSGFPVADTGDVDVAIVVFVEGSEYGVYRGLGRDENIGPRWDGWFGGDVGLPT